MLESFAGYGPVTHKNDTTKKEFITAIQNLRAYGGRDCPELSFTGMLEAYKADPQLGSPMFVFTDASAKDDTPEKKEELKTFADQYGTTINFFINKLGCGGAKGKCIHRRVLEGSRKLRVCAYTGLDFSRKFLPRGVSTEAHSGQTKLI